ncbi:gliding motility lipoprotein GldH [Allomuricauda sp. d1]|uniref:gliding motility lipoprotein GldH n=1 Tax=Allomuricauda sp. d1 TaxID=3136725 RepID=UPI0031D8C43D
MFKRLILLALVFGALVSCQENLVFSKFRPTSNGAWNASQIMQFEVSDLDSLQSYNLFISVRNDDTYPFSNLFLIAELERPSGNTVKDTLEYEMALPTGEWMGTGYGSIKENKLWYKENIVFRDTGVYKIKISHAMRKNGDVSGIQSLKGITDVGLEIEKSNQ